MKNLLKIIFIVTENIFLDFYRYKKYNLQEYKFFRKVAVELERGRPKLENPRQKTLNLRLSDSEYKKISRIAKEKNLTKTAAILKGIDLLEHDKPKRFKNLSKKKVKISTGEVDADIAEFL